MENTNNDLVVEKSSPSGSEAEIMRISPTGNLQFNSGFGSVELLFMVVRAWVRFNGQNWNNINTRNSGNVSSIN